MKTSLMAKPLRCISSKLTVLVSMATIDANIEAYTTDKFIEVVHAAF